MQSLNAEDQLFILMQAGLYLISTRGYSAQEARICYERVESLCSSLNRPLLRYTALMGQWRYSLVTDKVTATMQIARRVYSVAQQGNDSALMMEAYQALAVPLYFLGDFEAARQYARQGVQVCHGGVQSRVDEAAAHAVSCLMWAALTAWHFGEDRKSVV